MVDAGTTTSYTANNLNQYTAVGALAPVHDTNGNLTGSRGARRDRGDELIDVRAANVA